MDHRDHGVHREHRDGKNAELTERIIGCAIRVHEALGPGLLEAVYSACLCHEFKLSAIPFERERPIGVIYKGLRLECGFRADIVVANAVLVEIKSVEAILSVHESQVLTYLRLSSLPTGLLINFNTRLLKDGLRRFVN